MDAPRRRHGGSRYHVALLTVVAASTCAHLWRAGTQQDPALLPRGDGLYGSAHAARVYAAWPLAAAPHMQLAYMVRHFPWLFWHVYVSHWYNANAVCLAAALLSAAAARALRLGARGCAASVAAAYSAACAALALAYTLCGSVPPHMAHVRHHIWQCPPPSTALVFGQRTEALAQSGWQLGLCVALLGLPAPLLLLTSVVQYLCIASFLAVFGARYGAPTGQLAAWCSAPAPLVWADVAHVARQPPFLSMLLRSLVGAVLLPVVLRLALATRHRARAGGRGDAAAAEGDAAALAPRASARKAGSSGGGGPGVASGRHYSGDRGAAGACAAARHAQPAAARQQPLLRLPALMARLRAAQLAHAATAAPPCLYSSPVQGSTVLVKVKSTAGAAGRAADTHDAHEAALAALMPGVVCQAIEAAAAARDHGGAAGAAYTPVLLSWVGFRGCYQVAAQVAWQAAAAEEVGVAAAVAQALPEGVQLLDVAVAPLAPVAAAAAAAAGTWCCPVVLPRSGGAAVTSVLVLLPPALLAHLRTAGLQLRAVVSCGLQGTPFSDTARAAGDAGWPEDGALQLAVPRDADSLVVVTLLSAPARSSSSSAGTEAHGADTFLTAVPLLVLPQAACAELELLWAGMVAHWQCEQPGCELEEAASAVFDAHWRQLACDIALALQPDAIGTAQHEAVTASLRMYLAQHGLGACLALLPPGGVAGTAPAPPGVATAQGGGAGPSSTTALAGASANRGACSSSINGCGGAGSATQGVAAAARRAALLGFPTAGAERAFNAWKAQQLLVWDLWAFGCDAMCFGGLLVFWVWYAAVHDAASGARMLVVHLLVSGLCGLLPLLRAREWYAQRRGALLAGSALLSGACAAVLIPALGIRETVAHFGALIHRPFMYASFVHVLLPCVKRLGLLEQAVAGVGATLTSKMVLESRDPHTSWWWHVGLLVLSVAIAGALDAHMRVCWLRTRRTQPAGASKKRA